jgi:hypothetical protein
VQDSRLIEIIDLEKYRVAAGFKRAKVMFFVRVVGVAEIVVDRDSLDDARHGFGSECGNTGRNKGRTGAEVLAKFVIEYEWLRSWSSSVSPECVWGPMPWTASRFARETLPQAGHGR